MHRRLECVSQWASATECADAIFNFRSDELFILVLRAFFTVNVPSLQLSIIKLCVLPRLMSYLLLWPVNSVSTCPVRAPSFVGISDACATDSNRPTHTRIKWWIWIFRLLILIEEKNLIFLHFVWNECCSASSVIVHSLLTVGYGGFLCGEFASTDRQQQHTFPFAILWIQSMSKSNCLFIALIEFISMACAWNQISATGKYVRHDDFAKSTVIVCIGLAAWRVMRNI